MSPSAPSDDVGELVDVWIFLMTTAAGCWVRVQLQFHQQLGLFRQRNRSASPAKLPLLLN